MFTRLSNLTNFQIEIIEIIIISILKCNITFMYHLASVHISACIFSMINYIFSIFT